MSLPSIESEFRAITANEKHPLHDKAVKFEKFTQDLYASHPGQEWLQLLYVFCGHPMDHAPMPDAILSAHNAGRCEVTAFILRRGSDAAIPEVNPKQTTSTAHEHGQHIQRRKSAPGSRRSE